MAKMSLEKAIEILTSVHDKPNTAIRMDFPDACQLGIEAMERLAVGRNNPGTKWNDPLPGERKE